MYLPQISVVLNCRNEQKVKGMYSVYLRITIKRISKYYKIETPQKVRPDEWTNHDDCLVKNTHPFAFEINTGFRKKSNLSGTY